MLYGGGDGGGLEGGGGVFREGQALPDRETVRKSGTAWKKSYSLGAQNYWEVKRGKRGTASLKR